MEVIFATQKLRKECNDSKKCQRSHGPRRARLIGLRLDELRAAENLADVRQLPHARCHELHGNLAGLLSVDLDHPYRLLSGRDDPPPTRSDGGLDWENVTAVLILRVEDTHA
ncbi:MAG: killer suppression protein [Thermoanaerobaculia bacterium]|nr:killer suppression protein [Thermoanaerobaculia bacterium]